GRNDTSKRNYREITPEFGALGEKLKDFVVQIVFSPTLQILRRRLERKKIEKITGYKSGANVKYLDSGNMGYTFWKKDSWQEMACTLKGLGR
ncbi:hypothetical protein JRQ81_004016, partial [Phrynocephalus forsythii]